MLPLVLTPHPTSPPKATRVPRALHAPLNPFAGSKSGQPGYSTSRTQTHQQARLVRLDSLGQRLFNVNGAADAVLGGAQRQLHLPQSR